MSEAPQPQPEEVKWPESALREHLEEIDSLDKLHDMVGEITPEEQLILDGLDLESAPTDEELRLMEPGFTQRVSELTFKKIHDSQDKH